MATTPLQGKWLLALDGCDLPEKALIGGKAWSIAHMLRQGLPVPPAFVITTEACAAYLETGELPAGLDDELQAAMQWLEGQTGRTYGRGNAPLLVSVRSGAPISMPGMMDTVLNLGINAETMQAFAAESGDDRFARDTYRRFHELYGEIVLKVPVPKLSDDQELSEWRARIEKAAGEAVPDAPIEQLKATIEAVFRSWTSRRAKRYRKHHDIPDSLGTAVTVQAMVFGNLDQNSGTGVLFSRNPLTGEPVPYGEYLRCAQGEDVVSGKYTPEHLDDMKVAVPDAYKALIDAAQILESANREVQDIEFTVQHGKLYLLQSRTAKRSPAAAVRIAVDMYREGHIDIEDAIRRVNPDQVHSILSPRLGEGASAGATVLASGLGVSHGIGVGTVVSDADEAERRAHTGEDVVLATATTSPDDVHGMLVARAVITEQGGSTSHAAVVGRALGLPSVVGCGVGAVTALHGQLVTVDGEHGKIYSGALEVVRPQETEDDRLAELLSWARKHSPLIVYRPDEAPQDTLDLESNDDAADPANLPALIKGARGARGGAIASEAGVKAALQAGLEYIVAEPTLPALLAAIHAGGTTESIPSTEND
ncbi:pyruvate, phosphate dikinase [Kineobactrum sediminis]|uniref:Pyruvate, phosphate dikinase n=1 Tax=Kineobactrum sediminis TaxID=1905677 RepID=A0A2N5Y052_9GAMM|nr:pyruvate, phosphate dikinase [Kineobactrum sediminis]PLW81782.1 pyruvate, phosphate dikinase [Kineobactrum sediminis]